ncbi:GMC family oxidoreductase N-terminal domain-containing protein [Fibrella arboris]|uniref:GMC family oxidoreductase N-terminal domain-containing protein n=1 Tax=Fibrella arboris TaxID=3242486 RepID=UPI003521EF19
MIPFINLHGYTAPDPIDKASGFLKQVPLMVVNLFLTIGWLYLITETRMCEFHGIRLFGRTLPPFYTMFFEVLINLFIFSPLITGSRKSSSLIPFLVVFIPWIALDYYTQSHYRCAGCPVDKALWIYPDPSPISWVTSPLIKGTLAMAADGLLFGTIGLYLARLLAAVLFRKMAYPMKPSQQEYEALFNKEWSAEAVAKPASRGFAFWVLRLLGFAYLAYLGLLLLGLLGYSSWPQAAQDLVAMTYQNPALAINTFFKIALMTMLGFLGAYNPKLRYHACLALLIGHAVSTIYSLVFYYVDSLEATNRDFLLTSALADGAMMILFGLIISQSKKDRYVSDEDQAFPIHFSVPLTLTVYLFRTLTAVFLLYSAGVLCIRLLGDGTSGIAAVFGSPDPMLGNTLTLAGTLSFISFLLSKRTDLRPYFFNSLVVPLLFGGLVALLWITLGDLFGDVTIQTKQGGNVLVDWYFMLAGGIHIGLATLLIQFRRMYVRIDYSVNTVSPSAALNILALSDTLFATNEKQRSAILHAIDRYAGTLQGRKRGLLNLPFGLFENGLSVVYGFHPSFSTMSREERRYYLSTYFLRNQVARQRSMMPGLAEMAYGIGTTLNSIITFGNYSELNQRATVGFVPTGARDRLQGDLAAYEPPFKAIADLPANHTDALNFKPVATDHEAAKTLVAPRITTPVAEPDLPDEVDYLIVGSGAGGATAAYRLACQVADPSQIVVIERGRRLQPLQDFTDNEMDMMAKVYKEGGLQQTRKASMSILQGECLGGSTVVNNGVCFQMPASVRREWAQTYDIDLTKLDAEYQRIADELSIKPLDAKGVNQRVGTKFRQAVAAYNQGVPPGDRLLEHLPVSVNQLNTLGDGNWNLGNKSMRKRSMLETYIPWAEAKGVKFLSTYTAVRFTSSQARKATGVVLRSNNGALSTINVRKGVIVAGGVVASSHFLMRSDVPNPNIGRQLSCNFAFPLTFDFDDELHAYDGDQITLAAIDPQGRAAFETYFNPPATFALSSVPFFFDRRASIMDRYRHLLNFGALIGSEAGGVVHRKADILNGQAFDWQLGRTDCERIRYALGTLVELGYHAHAKRVMLPTKPGLEIPLNRQAIDKFTTLLNSFPLQMAELYMGTAHPQGGNLMAGPKSDLKSKRVLNEHFQVDGYDNVFVADASCFPTSLTVNPQYTIFAMSSLAVEQVLKTT